MTEPNREPTAIDHARAIIDLSYQAEPSALPDRHASYIYIARHAAEVAQALLDAHAEIERLRSILSDAAAPVCSMMCPAHWEGSEKPPHHPVCQMIQEELRRASKVRVLHERAQLDVCGITVAIEGERVPDDELRFLGKTRWTNSLLEWAASKINAEARMAPAKRGRKGAKKR